MLVLNGTRYRLCLLDTNAVSELVKHPDRLGHFLTWSLREQPVFIPCFSLFTVLELRRRSEIYLRFTERFGVLPCLLLKSHEQILEEETRCYPDPSKVDPSLLGFSGPVGQSGNRLANVLPLAFGTESILAQERYWNESRDDIVEGIRSLVPNFPPKADRYTPAEVRAFIEIAGFEQLVRRAQPFAERIVRSGRPVNIDAFPSLKATAYTVFYKFYPDRTRKPSASDAFDIIISAATPYVDVVVTENHQAECLRKAKRLDPFIQDLGIYTLRDLRSSLAGVLVPATTEAAERSR
jgi:hypothetical protein